MTVRFLLWMVLVASLAGPVRAQETENGSRSQSTRKLEPDPPATCDSCAAWNEPRPPFRVFGNTYFVGVGGLSSVLVTTDEGLVLIDGALQQSAARIDGNIRKLGFRTEDVKLILSSHAHFDHVGGIAALQRFTGAKVLSSEEGARALEKGESPPDDPQYRTLRGLGFPPVANVQAVADGEVVRLGSLALTAHYTPGHTPGGTSWSWRSCEGSRCVDVVYADSLSAVSDPEFRFSDETAHPGLVQRFRTSIATVADLPCDIVIAAHPMFTGVDDKLAKRAADPDGPNPFLDPEGCRAYAAQMLEMLNERLAKEKGR